MSDTLAPLTPDTEVPLDFTWTTEGEFKVDNLETFSSHIYSPEDAKKLLLKFQEFYKFLEDLIKTIETSEEAIELQKLYNRLVSANNHVL